MALFFLERIPTCRAFFLLTGISRVRECQEKPAIVGIEIYSSRPRGDKGSRSFGVIWHAPRAVVASAQCGS